MLEMSLGVCVQYAVNKFNRTLQIYQDKWIFMKDR